MIPYRTRDHIMKTETSVRGEDGPKKNNVEYKSDILSSAHMQRTNFFPLFIQFSFSFFCFNFNSSTQSTVKLFSLTLSSFPSLSLCLHLYLSHWFTHASTFSFFLSFLSIGFVYPEQIFYFIWFFFVYFVLMCLHIKNSNKMPMK